jgi:ubiquinone/menaquinone biosynthesis C-methylase UbiE
MSDHDPEIKKAVQERYRKAALRVVGEGASCCGEAPCEPISSNLYSPDETSGISPSAVSASLGCGNPASRAELKEGEIVLDLGSGGGIDVLLSARRVGPSGKAYGLDMTDEMLALARRHQRESDVTNAEFLKGEIENIPLPDGSVDVLLSNCVINLSADKDRVFREAFRVLKPGGRLAISDIVVQGPVPPALRKSVELWIGCIAGALEAGEVREKLARAGFEQIRLETSRVYRAEDARAWLERSGLDPESTAAQIDGKFTSSLIRAVKPRGGGAR